MEEVPAMRSFLDVGHTKHCVDARIVDTGMLDVCGSLRGENTQEELDSVVKKVYRKQPLTNPHLIYRNPQKKEKKVKVSDF